MSTPTNNEGYLIEMIALGGSMKVTALDPKTLREASVVTPSNMSQEEASELAIRKLRYLQDKKQGDA